MTEARARILDWIANQRRANFDPVTAWVKVTVPTLVYEGELDRFLPAHESAEIIGRALAKSGNRDYTIKVFPYANHGLWRAETGGPSDPLSVRVGDDVLMQWLVSRFVSRAAEQMVRHANQRALPSQPEVTAPV